MLDSRIGYIINEGVSVESDANIIADSGHRVVAEGILQDMDVQNRNGRIYESKDLIPGINTGRMKELLDAKQFKGESGHPIGDLGIARQQTIVPDRTCVRYNKVWVEGNLIKAQFQGTNNAFGETFNQDLLDGEKPAFSLRALGTIDNKSGKCYVRNIKIITWDHVIYPSHKIAYTSNLVTESAIIAKNKELESRDAYSTNESGTLIPITNESVMSYIKTESANIKSIMDNFDTIYESMSLIDNNTRVQLVDRTGDILVINLESKIQNDIFSYCSNR